MNREHLKKVRDFLENLPDEKFRMETWRSVDSSSKGCGTVACIGGWTELVANEGLEERMISDYKAEKINLLVVDHSQEYANFVSAADYLDLSYEQEDCLFYAKEFKNNKEYTIDMEDVTKADAIYALNSLIAADDDYSLPKWPEHLKREYQRYVD